MELIVSEKVVDVDVEEGLREAYNIMKKLASGINIDLEYPEVNERGWIRIKFFGEDSELFIELLRRKFGITPLSSSEIKIGDIFRGFVTDINEKCLKLDIGISSSEFKDGSYSLSRLQTQLFNGLDASIEEIVNSFCLHKGMPLEVRVVKIDEDGNLDLELSDEQIDYLNEWKKIPVERVIVSGALLKDVFKAIKSAKVDRDIIKTESLSLTIHILTCKLGTDATGIIAKISYFLKRPKFFSLNVGHYGKI